MTQEIQAFPLSWPAGWRRSAVRERAKFGKKVAHYYESYNHQTGQMERKRGGDRSESLTIAEGTQRVLESLSRMGVPNWNVIISSNLALRQDGLPRSGQRAPDDPGVAVYWTRNKERRCMAVDRYDRVQDNLAAIAATLEAMRAIDRHGGAAILDRAFQGFTALPSPESWWQVLGLNGPNATRDDVEQAHRRLIMKHHPDRGGDVEQASRINRARDQGLEAI